MEIPLVLRERLMVLKTVSTDQAEKTEKDQKKRDEGEGGITKAVRIDRNPCWPGVAHILTLSF